MLKLASQVALPEVGRYVVREQSSMPQETERVLVVISAQRDDLGKSQIEAVDCLGRSYQFDLDQWEQLDASRLP